MSSPGISSITRNTAFLAGAQAIGIATRLVWVIAAARLLGPDLYGLLAYSQAWYLAFLPLALFGLGPATSYLIAGERGRAPEIAAQALAIRVLTTIGAAAACLALSWNVTPDPRAAPLIAVLIFALVARAFTAWAQSLFLALEANQYTLQQETLFRILELVASLAIVVSGGSLMQLALAIALTSGFQAAMAMSLVHRHVLPVAFAWRPGNWRPLLVLAVPALLITLTADWRFNGTLILFRNLNDDGILFGQFSLAMQALAVAAVIPNALSNAAHPVLRRSVSRADGKDLLYGSLVQRSAVLIGTGAGLLGLVVGEPLFRLVLGEAYSQAGELAGLSLWCLIPLAAACGHPAVFIARGRFRILTIAGLAGAVVMTLLMVLLLPLYGAVGAFVAAFAGFAVPPLVVFVLACREGLAHPGADLLRPLAASAVSFIAYLLLTPISPWAGLAAGLAALVLASAAFGCIRRQDLVFLRPE